MDLLFVHLHSKHVCHAELEQQEAAQIMQNFDGDVTRCQTDMRQWLQRIVDGLQMASGASAREPPSCIITDLQPANNGSRDKVQIRYQTESFSQAFGSWTAHVLSKSSQGENGTFSFDLLAT